MAIIIKKKIKLENISTLINTATVVIAISMIKASVLITPNTIMATVLIPTNMIMAITSIPIPTIKRY